MLSLPTCLRPCLAGLLLVAAAPAALAQAPTPPPRTQAGYYRLALGDFTVTALSDGTIALPAAKLLLNTTPAQVHQRLARNFLPNSVPTSINAYLIDTGTQRRLVDTGAGSLFGASGGHLLTSLRAAGYEPAQIDAVLLTHIHADHSGGLVQGPDRQLTFPNATVYVAQRAADFWLTPANRSKVPARHTHTFRPKPEALRKQSDVNTQALAGWRTKANRSLPLIYTLPVPMSANPFAPFYASAMAGSRRPERPSATGQFKVYNLAELMANCGGRPPMSFDRRPFYKISLLCGRSRVEYADQALDVDGRVLWFATSRVPYRWSPHDAAQTGYLCLFTDEFLRPVRSGLVLEELPVFESGGCPVLVVSEAEYDGLVGIFEKMQRESNSGYAYRDELLRAYLLELIYHGQKLRPDLVPLPAPTAAVRLARQFAELLERQFPLAVPRQHLSLRTPRDFADALAVHVNHLNRVLKDATGHTTTELLSSRVAQEARQLLKHASWTVAEIADSLGFTDTAHFCRFFRRQTGIAPGDFRTRDMV